MPTAIDLENAIDKTQLSKVKTLLSQKVKPGSKRQDGYPQLYWVIIRLWNFRLDGAEKKRETMRSIGNLLVEAGAPLDIFSAVILGHVEESAAMLAKRPELVRRRFPLNGHLLGDMAGYCGEAGPEIFALLKKAAREAPPYDWDKAESDLYDAAVEELARIAKKNKKTVFSAFAFDCDPGNSTLLIALNAESNPLDSEWNPVGDYSHGNSGEWELDLRVSDLLSESLGSAAKNKKFMEIACRVALRLESGSAFDVLKRTEDFDILVTDHDEALKKAVGRLKRMRTKMATAPKGSKAAKKKAPAKATPAAKKKASAKAKKTPSKAKGVTRLEFSQGASNKFWEITIKGKEHTVCYGRIGSDGQSKTKSFASAQLAAADADKLIAQKKKKGYS